MGQAGKVAPERFRAALGQFATGVTVVTTTTPDGIPVGLTVNSFSSVSLEPQLVLWSLADGSPSLRAFSDRGAFAINILATDQRHLGLRFSQKINNKFNGVDYEFGFRDLPLISGALAQIECETHSEIPAGDHVIFIGRVVNLRSRQGAPLVYHASRFVEVLESQERARACPGHPAGDIGEVNAGGAC